MYIRAFSAFIALAVTLLFFQNCGKFGVSDGPAESMQSSSTNHNQPHVMRASATEELRVDMRFEAHGALEDATYAWSFTLNGASTGCVEKSANNLDYYLINCDQAGSLIVRLQLNQEGSVQTLSYSTTLTGASDSNEIPLEVVFEIPAGTNNSPWNTAATRVETFVGQKLKLRNLDSSAHRLHTNGRPCPHGPDIPPGAMVDCVISQTYARETNGAVYDHYDGTSAEFYLVSYSGPTLYQTNCQSCHGPLATSQRKNATVSQITAAIASVPAMRTAALMALTLRQKQAIAFALKSP